MQEVSPAPQVKYLSDKDEARVHDCASLCRGLLGEILTDGLVRMPDDMPARIEAAAVRCHGLKAADAERVMRKVGGLLTAHLQRRASFSDHEFARKLCEADTLLAALEKGRLTEGSLGEFRRSYEPVAGELSLLPIGAPDVSGGEYKGEIYYFLDENRTSGRDFLTISDMRPTYYEDSTRSRRVPPLSPWDLGATLSSVMRSKLVLVGAKVSGEKLSSSAETKVASQAKASLNCPAVHKLIIDDFRQIAAELDEAGEYETDRMFFIHPTKCCYHRFDKYSQNFIMEIEDWRGCRIKVKAKFRAETKAFIELLEKIARRMVGNTDANYTILGTASVQNGELTIFPIEIYDFIDYFDDKQYFLPEKYDGAEALGGYAYRLLSLFTRLRNTLAFIVHCGLRSEIRDEDKLTKRAENCGMAHLAELTSALLDSASAYRHSLGGDAGSILQKMSALYEYIELGEKRLQTITALAKKYGVSTGETVWMAKKKCPSLVTARPTYGLYEDVSRRMNKIFYDYTDLVEPFGMDESWLDVTGSSRLFGDGEKIAGSIRARVKSELGITVSVGVSFNKVFAKLGSDLKKPDATSVIPYNRFASVVWPMPVGALLFAGRAVCAKLKGVGINTVGDLASTDPAFISRFIGKTGPMLRDF
ncbi:hypothetical protein, partial [uncultured Ruminococcus sp.]|uniref:DNA polymerase Y family protein n=1 Tax=uncultured Ruminococcus sp. TaxID=165186 RepID=UPI0025E75DE7